LKNIEEIDLIINDICYRFLNYFPELTTYFPELINGYVNKQIVMIKKAMFNYKLGKITTVFLSLLGTVIIANPSQAQIPNGSFEDNPTQLDNLTPWNKAGDVIKTDSSYGSDPTDGSLQALLTTANLLETDSALNASGTDPLLTPDLESFLGLEPGTLNPPNTFGALEGSAIFQDFTAQAGDILTLDWNFLSNDTFSDDYAFIVLALEGDLASLTYDDLPKLNKTLFTVPPSSGTIFDGETGFQTFSRTLITAGTYRIGIGVVDVDDAEGASAVLVDNVRLTPADQSVPEPATAIAVIGFGIIGITKKRFSS
jgi:hypothetical protein